MFSEVFVGEITSQVLIFIKKFLYEPLLSDIFKNTPETEFPGSPMVKTLPSNSGAAGSISGRGAKIGHVLCSVAQLCLIFCSPMDCSPPACSAHGIFQARILEQVVISFSRRSS